MFFSSILRILLLELSYHTGCLIVKFLLIPFLLESVEASHCHFFKNWLMKHKYSNLLNPLGNVIQEKSLRGIYFRSYHFETPCSFLDNTICIKYQYFKNLLIMSALHSNSTR